MTLEKNLRLTFLLFSWFNIVVQYSSRQSAMLSLQSSELGPPAPSPEGECCPPPLVPGGAHSLAGEGVGGPTSDEGTGTVELNR